MKHVIKQVMHVHASKDYGKDEVRLSLYLTDMSEYGYICLGKLEVEVPFDLPEDFSFEGEQVKALQKEKKSVQAQCQSRLNQIDEQIARLLCIEYKAEPEGV